MKPKTIVSVLDSLSPAKDVALTRALSLADWYESANEAIALAASGWGADLVVLGLPRRSRMEAFVVGSTVLRAGCSSVNEARSQTRGSAKEPIPTPADTQHAGVDQQARLGTGWKGSCGCPDPEQTTERDYGLIAAIAPFELRAEV